VHKVKFIFPERHNVVPMWELRQDILSSPLSVALERAYSYTRMFKEHEGAPWIVKKALGFRAHLNTVPLYIRMNDKIAGSICETPGGMPLLPELGIGENTIFTGEDPHQAHYLKDQVPAEISEYWNGQNAWAHYQKYMEDVVGAKDVAKKPGWIFSSCQGHLCPSYQALLEVGLKGLLDQVQSRSEREARPEAREFLEAAELCPACRR
jgi:hypothetical protein